MEMELESGASRLLCIRPTAPGPSLLDPGILTPRPDAHSVSLKRTGDRDWKQSRTRMASHRGDCLAECEVGKGGVEVGFTARDSPPLGLSGKQRGSGPLEELIPRLFSTLCEKCGFFPRCSSRDVLTWTQHKEASPP